MNNHFQILVYCTYSDKHTVIYPLHLPFILILEIIPMVEVGLSVSKLVTVLVFACHQKVKKLVIKLFVNDFCGSLDLLTGLGYQSSHRLNWYEAKIRLSTLCHQLCWDLKISGICSTLHCKRKIYVICMVAMVAL